ncbi:DUF7507 domain-containing protein [Xylanimonas protaetiae]|uniref:DUF7507 domain-containing protein n=1 Tax=Xylanimonas protaetiae TaxID=2509457 RepID=A0A4P6F9N5_9MICO|nr:hypothetical protein [Xylanimonas protaetiae]QAY70989.1 hypothetical protein ET471_13920 [Xylanimonas protaetiae]
MRLRRSIAAIAVVAAGIGVGLGTASPSTAGVINEPSPGTPQQLLKETFTGSTFTNSAFTLLGHAGLTNAPDPTPTEDPSTLDPCKPMPSASFAPKLGCDLKDDDGKALSPPLLQADARRDAPKPSEADEGFLQLTDSNHDKVGGVLYNSPLPTRGGLDITFEMYQFNSTTRGQYARGHRDAPAADGIGFFITDGTEDKQLTEPGAYGGSLGYAQKYDQWNGTWTPGVSNGYLGIGFDVLGNYIQDDTECRGSTGMKWRCTFAPGASRSPAGTEWGQNVPNTITLRGPGNGFNGYEYLTSTVVLDGDGVARTSSLGSSLLRGPSVLDEPWRTLPERLASSKRLVRIIVSPEANPLVRVFIAFDGAESTLAASTPLLSHRMTQAMPEYFKFGFTGSTGDFTDVHLIRMLEVTTLVNPPSPALTIEKSVDGKVDGYQKDEQIAYKFDVVNTGDTVLTGITIEDDLIDHGTLSPSAGVTLAPGETAQFTGHHKLTAAEIDDAQTAPQKCEFVNTAHATARFGAQEVTSVSSAASVTVAGCSEPASPPPNPGDAAGTVPLPAVGGPPSTSGGGAIAVIVALTAYLFAARRRRGTRKP